MKAEDRVKKTIEERRLINRGDVLVLGLSGGPDSLCLLHVLKGLEEEMGFKLTAFHLNHMIREDAGEDEAFAVEECERLGIPLRTLREDVRKAARDRGESLEEAGRKIRQDALRDICAELRKGLEDGCDARAVLAHNKDDQAETVLMRIIRGTGVHGLAAMEYMRKDGLIRPLLDTERKDVEEYCARMGLKPRTDSTNASTEYLRNRVRLEILPAFEEINPSVKEGLTRLASNAAADDACLSELAESWYEEHVKRCCETVLRVKDLRGLEEALYHRVVKLAFAEAGLKADIEAVHVKALARSVSANVGNKTVEFPGGYVAYINHGEVVFRKR